MHKISNKALFLMIINSIIGGGLFINLDLFNAKASSLSPVLYSLGYLIFLPIIFCIGFLAQRKSVEGGLFYLAKSELGETLGFTTAWCYFLGRIVSVGVLITGLSKGLIANFPIFESFSELKLATITISSMSLLHILGLRNSGIIQKLFTTAKLLPIVLLTILGSFFLSTKNLNISADSTVFFANFKDLLPSAIYAMQGFTIVIHIGHQIKNPSKILKTLILGTATAAILCICFQAVVFLNVGATNSQGTLLAFFGNIGIANPSLLLFLNNLINYALVSCAFMILTGNSWNLYTLANNDFIPGKTFFLRLINGVPVFCVIIHATISLFFVSICQNLPGLQAASVFAAFFTYLLCSIAATKNFYSSSNKLFLPIGLAAIVSAVSVLFICFKKIVIVGLSYEFALFFMLGVFFLIKKHFFKEPKKI